MDEVTVGVLTIGQAHAVGRQTGSLEFPGKGLGSDLARLVFVLVEDDVEQEIWPVAKLLELRGCQMGAEGAGGVAKAGLPQHRQIEQAFDQDHRWKLAD